MVALTDLNRMEMHSFLVGTNVYVSAHNYNCSNAVPDSISHNAKIFHNDQHLFYKYAQFNKYKIMFML